MKQIQDNHVVHAQGRENFTGLILFFPTHPDNSHWSRTH